MKTQTFSKLQCICIIFIFCFVSLKSQTNSQNPEEITLDTNLLKTYVGRYAYEDGTISNIMLEAGQLFVQYTGKPRLEIFPASETEFYLKVVEARLKFVKDENGKVTHLIHYQNGMQFEPRRLPDETIVKIDPAIFEQYVGKFMGDNSQIIEIYRDGDLLFGRTQGLPTCQLLPVSETEYFPMELNARIWFMVEGDGTINTLNIDYNGYQSIAVRIKE